MSRTHRTIASSLLTAIASDSESARAPRRRAHIALASVRSRPTSTEFRRRRNCARDRARAIFRGCLGTENGDASRMPPAAGATSGASARILGVRLFVYAPIALLLGAWAFKSGPGIVPTVALMLGGGGVWTFFEYWIHRLVLHAIPRGSARRYVAGRHILHHHNPSGHPGTALLWVSAIVAVTVFSSLLVALSPAVAAATMTGIVLGYLCYEYAHLATHLGTKPLTPWGKWLRRHHLVHHHLSSRHNFAILLPLWDWVFQTQRPDESA